MEEIFGTHQLTLGIKGNLFHTVHDLTHIGVAQIHPGRHFQQRIFRGISDPVSIHDGGIIG